MSAEARLLGVLDVRPRFLRFARIIKRRHHVQMMTKIMFEDQQPLHLLIGTFLPAQLRPRGGQE